MLLCSPPVCKISNTAFQVTLTMIHFLPFSQRAVHALVKQIWKCQLFCLPRRAPIWSHSPLLFGSHFLLPLPRFISCQMFCLCDSISCSPVLLFTLPSLLWHLAALVYNIEAFLSKSIIFFIFLHLFSKFFLALNHFLAPTFSLSIPLCLCLFFPLVRKCQLF